MARLTRARSGISAAGVERRFRASVARANTMGVVRIVLPPAKGATSHFSRSFPGGRPLEARLRLQRVNLPAVWCPASPNHRLASRLTTPAPGLYLGPAMGTTNVAGAALPSFHAGNERVTNALPLPASAGAPHKALEKWGVTRPLA